MIIIHFFISLCIALFINVPAFFIAWPCLAIMLLTKWDGRTYFFGNSKHGRATNHYLAPTQGKYWKELLWMGWRNPTYNLGAHYLSIKMRGYTVKGSENIGDKIRPGFYAIRMGWAWEYYWIYKYKIFGTWRCIRVRVGWKISGNTGKTAEQVFVPNPIMPYRGV